MKMTKEKWVELVVTALGYGVVFTLCTMVFNYFSHTSYPWYAYLFEGVFFGILMTVFTMFCGKKKA